MTGTVADVPAVVVAGAIATESDATIPLSVAARGLFCPDTMLATIVAFESAAPVPSVLAYVEMPRLSFCATGAEILSVHERLLPPLFTTTQFGDDGVSANTCRTPPDGVTAMDWVAVETYCGLRAALDVVAWGTMTVIVAEAVPPGLLDAFWAGMTLPPPPPHAPSRLVMVTRTIVRFITWCSEDSCRVESEEELLGVMIFTSVMLPLRLDGESGRRHRDAHRDGLTERVVNRYRAGAG